MRRSNNAQNCTLVDRSFLWQAHECLFYYINISATRLDLHSNLGYRKAHHINAVACQLERFPNVWYHVRTVVFHGSALDDSNTLFLVQLIAGLPRLKQFMFRGLTFVDDASAIYLSRIASSFTLVEELGFRRCVMSKKALETLSPGGSHLPHGCCYITCLCVVLMTLQILDLRSTHVHVDCLPFSTFGTIHEMHLSVSRVILSQDASAYDWVALASFAQVCILKVAVYNPSNLKFVSMILASATALESLKLCFCHKPPSPPTISILLNIAWIVTAYKIWRSTTPELALDGLPRLTNLLFHGAISALQFLQHSIDTIAIPMLTDIWFNAGFHSSSISLQHHMGILNKLDDSLLHSINLEAFVGITCMVLQHVHAIGEADRECFMKYTFLKTCSLICKKFVFEFGVWFWWLKNRIFARYH